MWASTSKLDEITAVPQPERTGADRAPVNLAAKLETTLRGLDPQYIQSGGNRVSSASNDTKYRTIKAKHKCT